MSKCRDNDCCTCKYNKYGFCSHCVGNGSWTTKIACGQTCINYIKRKTTNLKKEVKIENNENFIKETARIKFLYEKIIKSLRVGKKIIFSEDGKSWKAV